MAPTPGHGHARARRPAAWGLDARGKRRFFRAPAPSPAEVEQVLARIVRRVGALLDSRLEGDELPDDEELALAHSCAAAAARSDTETHRPEDALDDEPDTSHLPTRRKARIERCRSEHSDLDAEVAVHEYERDRLEYLSRYLLRPPLSLEPQSLEPQSLDRLKVLGAELIALELKRPWRDGTTHVTMTPSVFLGCLAALVPRPRVNTTLYFGVKAGNARERSLVVPRIVGPLPPRHVEAPFAALMRRSFGLDVLGCRPAAAACAWWRSCSTAKRSSASSATCVACRDPPPIHPARGPPEHEESLDFP